MSEKSANTEVIDASNKFFPEYVEEDGSLEVSNFLWNESEKQRVMAWLNRLWDGLRPEIFKLTGVNTPPFDESMIRWVQFNSGQRAREVLGDNHPVSGLIRLNPQKLHSYGDVAQTVVHEVFHAISQRKLLKREDAIVPVRTGLAVIGNTLAGKQNSEFKFESWGFNILNEALIEIVSQRVLDQAAPTIPELRDKHFEPSTYKEARRFYKALIRNIVLAWNDPNLRDAPTDHNWSRFEGTPAWSAAHSEQVEDKMLRVKNELGFTDQITEEEVEKLFEQTIWDKHALPKVAHLINALFGVGAWKHIYEITSRINPGKPEGMYSLWHLINQPATTDAKRPRDVGFTFNGQYAWLGTDTIPSGISTKSYDREDGEVLGIGDIFNHYERLLENPLDLEDVPATVVLAERLLEHGSREDREYPFDQTVVHIPRENTIMLTTRQDDQAWCFNELKKLLDVNETAHYQKTKDILGTKFVVKSYAAAAKRGVDLTSVTVERFKMTPTTYYFFTKNLSPVEQI